MKNTSTTAEERGVSNGLTREKTTRHQRVCGCPLWEVRETAPHVQSTCCQRRVRQRCEPMVAAMRHADANQGSSSVPNLG